MPRSRSGTYDHVRPTAQAPVAAPYLTPRPDRTTVVACSSGRVEPPPTGARGTRNDVIPFPWPIAIASAGPLAGVICVARSARRRRVGRLALRPDAHTDRRLVLVVGGVGVRQPGRLRLLRRLRGLRRARMGRRDGVVRAPARPLAIGALGEAVHATAR